MKIKRIAAFLLALAVLLVSLPNVRGYWYADEVEDNKGVTDEKEPPVGEGVSTLKFLLKRMAPPAALSEGQQNPVIVDNATVCYYFTENSSDSAESIVFADETVSNDKGEVEIDVSTFESKTYSLCIRAAKKTTEGFWVYGKKLDVDLAGDNVDTQTIELAYDLSTTFTVTGGNVEYDPNGNQVSVAFDASKAPNYSLLYSTDGTNWSGTNPSFGPGTTSTVYVKAVRDQYPTIIKQAEISVGKQDHWVLDTTGFGYSATSDQEVISYKPVIYDVFDGSENQTRENPVATAVQAALDAGATVTYSSSGEVVAVNAETGALTLLKEGTENITVTISATSEYNGIVFDYTVDTRFVGFAEDYVIVPVDKWKNTEFNQLSFLKSTDGDVLYSVEAAEGSPADGCQIDPSSGKLTVKQIGRYVVTAIYNGQTYTCEVLALKFRYYIDEKGESNRVQLYVDNESNPINLYYGLKSMQFSIPDSANYISNVEYEIVGGTDIVEESDPLNAPGKFVFKDNGLGSFQIIIKFTDTKYPDSQQTVTSWFTMQAKPYEGKISYFGVASDETWKTNGLRIAAENTSTHKIAYDNALNTTFDDSISYKPDEDLGKTVYVKWSDNDQTYISAEVALDTIAPSVDENYLADPNMSPSIAAFDDYSGVYVIDSPVGYGNKGDAYGFAFVSTDQGGSGFAYAKVIYKNLITQEPQSVICQSLSSNIYMGVIYAFYDCPIEIELYDHAGNMYSMKSTDNYTHVDYSAPVVNTDTDIYLDQESYKSQWTRQYYEAGTRLRLIATDEQSGVVGMKYWLGIKGVDPSEDDLIEVAPESLVKDADTLGRVTASINVDGQNFSKIVVRVYNYFGYYQDYVREFDHPQYVETAGEIDNLSLSFEDDSTEHYRDEMTLVLTGDNLGEIRDYSFDPGVIGWEVKDVTSGTKIIKKLIKIKQNLKGPLTISITGREETITVVADKEFVIETKDGEGSVDIENITEPIVKTDDIVYFNDEAKLRIYGACPFSGIAELKYQLNDGEYKVIPDTDIVVSPDGLKYEAEIDLPQNTECNVHVVMTSVCDHRVEMTTGTMITDSVAPEIKVSFDNNNDSMANCFSDDRKMTIKVSEQHFHADRMALQIRSKDDDINVLFENSDFRVEKDKDGNTWYAVDYLFDAENSYDCTITCSDYSGNNAEPYVVPTFVIDRTAPVINVRVNDEDATYNNGQANIVIEITDQNFTSDRFTYKLVSAKDAKGNDIQVTPKDDTGNELDPSLGDVFWSSDLGDGSTAPVNSCHFSYDKDAQYVFDIEVIDKSGNKTTYHREFFIDTTAPAGAELILPKEVRKDKINGIDYRFYDGKIELGIRSSDVSSGIASISYECLDQLNNTVFQSGHFDLETAYSATGIAREDDVLSNETALVSFEINKDFRGRVKITVIDRCGNEYVKTEDVVVVVDTVKPVIAVGYDNNSVKNGKYYSADRTAIISLTEANYFAEDNGTEPRILNIKVSKTDSTTGKKSDEYLTAPLTAVEDKPGSYQCSYRFGEDAAYTLSITYADRSGNKAADYQSPEFVIDKTAPKLHVSYNNNEAKNNDQFKAKRKATIVIEENNFDPLKVAVAITSGGTALPEYQAYLNDPSNWTHTQNSFVAEIMFEKEGHYTFDISCRDLAENENINVDYADSVAPNKFTVDTTEPTGMTMKVGDTSILGSMDTVAFERFYQSAITVKLSANCDISGLQSLQYQKVDSALAYSPANAWTDYNDATGIVIAPSEKCIIYFKAEDRAGNVAIVRSVGMVIDDKEPVGEVNAPEIDIVPDAANARGYHNSDVNVALKVLDPAYVGSAASGHGYFSGLKSITYRIYASDLETVESGVLLDLESKKVDGAVFDADGLISTWSGTIKVDAAKFNSNNVIVEINAVDNSGNVRNSKNKADIKIDITKPVASVSYDNNVAYYGQYFNANRVATIVVTERNFDPALFNLSLTNTAGEVPALSSWEQVAGTGNGDSNKWIAKLVFTKDGDYTFEFSFADAADNAAANISFGDSVCPNAFTMDQTRPVITLDFDNKDAQHENYYNKDRKATITVIEHNFDPNLVTVAQSAVLDEQVTAVPELSEWTSKGDTHTATLQYSDDAYYVLSVNSLDKANNAAESEVGQAFYVDKEVPQIRITGVEDGGAYNGNVQPSIECEDVNFDPQNVQIVIERSLKTDVPMVANSEEIRHGLKTTYENVQSTEENDDIYSLKVTVTDMAGNQSVSEVKFSINRFGSTYSVDEALSSILGTYISNPSDIVLKEINPDELSDIRVTVFKNNETIVLKEDEDYTVSVGTAKGDWKEYSFLIKGSNFQDDGVYRVSLHSQDKAGNVSENTMETKNTAISFGVDKTVPRVVVTNVENGKTYALDNLPVEMTVSDNLQLASVKVFLDGEDNLLKEWSEEEIRNMESDRMNFDFNISGESKQSHKLLVVAVDSAGNEQREEITGFYVTKDLFVRFVNNKPLLYSSIAILTMLLAGGIGLAIFLKNKKKRY